MRQEQKKARKKWLIGLAVLAVVAGCASPPEPTAGYDTTPAPPAAVQPAAAPAGGALPRVMVLVDEKSLGTIPTEETAALTAHRLLAAGFTVVNQDMARSNIKREQELRKMAGDARGAAVLGLEFGADVVIMGDAVAKPSARRIAESNLRTYQAVVTLQAIRTDNSAVLATASEDASVIGVDDAAGSSKALKAAAAKSVDALLPAMTAAWQRSGAAASGAFPHRVTLSVGGVDQMWKLKAVREHLRGMNEAARNVTQRSYTAGLAVFDLETAEPPEEFAERLVLAPPAGLKMQVLNLGPGKIDLRAVAQ